MRLPFTDGLILTHKFDAEMAILADLHYSRQTHGSNQFMPPGHTLVIRDCFGDVLFGWLHQQYRDDGERGYCCSIFRNHSDRKSSEIILECERLVFERWGAARLFTYVDPDKVRSPNPGYCFKMAGWSFVRKSKEGKHLLAKDVNGRSSR